MMAGNGAYSGSKRRKRDRDLVERLLEESRSQQVNEWKKLTISFQNGESSFDIGEATNYYTYGKCDYDDDLIGSPDYWHQIIVC